MTDYFKQAEKALTYLEDSEQEFAILKARHQAEDKRRKIVRASLIIDSPNIIEKDGIERKATAADRTAWAESQSDYRQSVDDWEQAMESFYFIDAKRTRANLTIEMYRSVNSSLKKGNI